MINFIIMESYDKLINSLILFDTKLIEEKNVLGRGGFGKVVEGCYNQLKVALKKFYSNDVNVFVKETKIIKILNHQNKPSLYGVCEDLENSNYKQKSYCLVNELVKGMNLDNFFDRIGDNCFIKCLMFLDLADILTFIHGLKLIHRDLKPSNVMIDSNLNLKLLDFGISRLASHTNTNTITIGTILYMAPENYDVEVEGFTMQEIAMCKISTKVDVWAFGCMMSEAFSGHRPWAPKIKLDTGIISALIKRIPFYIPKNIEDESLRDIIKDCTEVNNLKRKNILQIKESLLLYVLNGIKEAGMEEIMSTLEDFPPQWSKYLYNIFRI